jgi:hypothetical protein
VFVWVQEEQEKEEEEEDSEDPCTHIRHEILGHQDTVRTLRDSLSKIDSETAKLREVGTFCISTCIIKWHNEINSLCSTLSLIWWWIAILQNMRVHLLIKASRRLTFLLPMVGGGGGECGI